MKFNLVLINSSKLLSYDFLKKINFRFYCTDLNKKINNINLIEFTCDRIRNFCIIAHVDHGKSTLSDRFLEETNLISKKENINLFLDKLQVEKDKGITVKAQTVSLIHKYKGLNYLLNLIDTPGHVDFSYEVWRSLPACQGSILLVDASKGIQAQTISHFNQALLSGLVLLPVINKIDVKNANPNLVSKQMKKLFSFNNDEILHISAKNGLGISNLLDKIIMKIPSPLDNSKDEFNAFIFDIWYTNNEGLICQFCVKSGTLKVDDKIKILNNNSSKIYKIKKLGIFHPNEVDVKQIYCGQIGFFSAHIFNVDAVSLGDLIIKENNPIIYKKDNLIPEAKQVVYAGIFSYNENKSQNLKSALKKLSLNDKSVIIEHDSNALGHQFQVGFLGLLHMEVFCQRLEQEFDSPTVITAPNVTYKVKIKGQKNIKMYGKNEILVKNPKNLPQLNIIEYIKEPMVKGTIIVPHKYIKNIEEQTKKRRGFNLSKKFIDENTVLIENKYPLNEIIVNFYDELKSLTSGFASFDYVEDGYEKFDAAILKFTLNGQSFDELTMIVPKTNLLKIAKNYCLKIKNNLKKQQYDIDIKAYNGKKLIAKEIIKALGKNVTQKLYGGDVTRAKKLLQRQEEGKKHLKMIGKIQISREIFIEILKK